MSAGVEARLRNLEDRLDIIQLMMSHPLAVDSCSLDFWEKVWTEDAIQDRGAPDPNRHSGNYSGTYGKAVILEEVNSPEMHALRAAGFCHNTTVPYIKIDGDSAIATNYTQLLAFEDGAFKVRRVVANRWTLVRGPDGWMIKGRTFRLLNGQPSAIKILHDGLPREASPA